MKRFALLENVAEIIMGQSPPSTSYNTDGKGLPFFQGKVEFSNKYPIIKKWCDSPIKISEPNDILLSVRAPVGPTNICNVKSCIGRGLTAIRCKKDMDYLFLWFYLRSIEKKIAGRGVGSTFTAIGRNEISKIKVPLISYATQCKIASILDKAESTRQKRQEANRLTDEFLKSAFLEMFGDPIKNPKKWQIKKIQSVCLVESGGTPSTAKKEYWESGKIPWLGSTACKDNFIKEATAYITEEGFQNSSAKLFKLKTTLIALVGATIGKTGFLTFESTTNQNIAGIYPMDTNYLVPEYIFFTAQYLYPKFMTLSKSGFKMANLSFIRNLDIPVPPAEQQQRFADLMRRVERLKEKQCESEKELNNLFNSLMQKTFRGDIYN